MCVQVCAVVSVMYPPTKSSPVKTWACAQTPCAAWRRRPSVPDCGAFVRSLGGLACDPEAPCAPAVAPPPTGDSAADGAPIRTVLILIGASLTNVFRLQVPIVCAQTPAAASSSAL